MPDKNQEELRPLVMLGANPSSDKVSPNVGLNVLYDRVPTDEEKEHMRHMFRVQKYDANEKGFVNVTIDAQWVGNSVQVRASIEPNTSYSFSFPNKFGGDEGATFGSRTFTTTGPEEHEPIKYYPKDNTIAVTEEIAGIASDPNYVALQNDAIKEWQRSVKNLENTETNRALKEHGKLSVEEIAREMNTS